MATVPSLYTSLEVVLVPTGSPVTDVKPLEHTVSAAVLIVTLVDARADATNGDPGSLDEAWSVCRSQSFDPLGVDVPACTGLIETCELTPAG